MLDPMNPPVPPISSRDEPRFRSEERKRALASAFRTQGQDYDRLRPGYPPAVIDAILRHVPAHSSGSVPSQASATAGGSIAAKATGGEADAVNAAAARADAADARFARAVDLGAGTGKLSWALAARGLEVTAVDPSEAMLKAARHARPGAGPGSRPGEGEGAEPDEAGAPVAGLRTHVASAEETGLPGGSAELVTAAQAWHWFDAEAASAEAARLLVPGGALALVWNMLDVTIPWVHRLSRIMHAGDVHREDFAPTVAGPFVLRQRLMHTWEDPMPTHDVIDLARTRSYVITAPEERRAKVLANLDWYLHEHLGHAPGATVGVPYRTDLFVYTAA